MDDGVCFAKFGSGQSKGQGQDSCPDGWDKFMKRDLDPNTSNDLVDGDIWTGFKLTDNYEYKYLESKYN